MGGGLLFNEFDDFGMEEWIIFPSSVCVTFIGVYLITAINDNPTKEKSVSQTREKSSPPSSTTCPTTSGGSPQLCTTYPIQTEKSPNSQVHLYVATNHQN